MPNNVVTIQNVRRILQLLQRGVSLRQIACELDLSRNTVKLYTDRFNAGAYSLDQLQQMDDAGLHAIAYADASKMWDNDSICAFKLLLPYFQAEFKRTSVTKYLLWQEYKKDNPAEFGHSQFCDLFARYGKIQKPPCILSINLLQ